MTKKNKFCPYLNNMTKLNIYRGKDFSEPVTITAK